MADILCLGEALFELNRQPPDADGRTHWLEGHGGDTSNAAVAAARNGAQAAYLSAVGDDMAGDSLLALWARERVDATRVRRIAGAPTGLYLVTHDDGGHRFHFRRSGSAASQLAPADIEPEVLRGVGILHMSGISQAISASACDACFHAIALARGAGARVSYDTNLRTALWPATRAAATMHAAMAGADYALPSLDDARALTGLEAADAIADFYLRLGCKHVFLKLGREGALVATADHRERVAPFAVTAVDATGAGDTFAGALLARLSAGDDPFAAARYANAAAALSTTGYGAVAPIPRPDAVRALLADGPR